MDTRTVLLLALFGALSGACGDRPPPSHPEAPGCIGDPECGIDRVCQKHKDAPFGVCVLKEFADAGAAEGSVPTASDAGAVDCPPRQHRCPCATGSYCLAGNAMCMAPTAPCPPATDASAP